MLETLFLWVNNYVSTPLQLIYFGLFAYMLIALTSTVRIFVQIKSFEEVNIELPGIPAIISSLITQLLLLISIAYLYSQTI